MQRESARCKSRPQRGQTGQNWRKNAKSAEKTGPNSLWGDRPSLCWLVTRTAGTAITSQTPEKRVFKINSACCIKARVYAIDRFEHVSQVALLTGRQHGHWERCKRH
jgi:hypothetical protein